MQPDFVAMLDELNALGYPDGYVAKVAGIHRTWPISRRNGVPVREHQPQVDFMNAYSMLRRQGCKKLLNGNAAASVPQQSAYGSPLGRCLDKFAPQAVKDILAETPAHNGYPKFAVRAGKIAKKVETLADRRVQVRSASAWLLANGFERVLTPDGVVWFVAPAAYRPQKQLEGVVGVTAAPATVDTRTGDGLLEFGPQAVKQVIVRERLCKPSLAEAQFTITSGAVARALEQITGRRLHGTQVGAWMTRQGFKHQGAQFGLARYLPPAEYWTEVKQPTEHKAADPQKKDRTVDDILIDIGRANDLLRRATDELKHRLLQDSVQATR